MLEKRLQKVLKERKKLIEKAVKNFSKRFFSCDNITCLEQPIRCYDPGGAEYWKADSVEIGKKNVVVPGVVIWRFKKVFKNTKRHDWKFQKDNFSLDGSFCWEILDDFDWVDICGFLEIENSKGI